MTVADLVAQLDAFDPGAEIFVLVERENQASLMAPVTEVLEVAEDENAVLVLRVAPT